MLAFAIFTATLVLVIWQPRDLGIGWSAMGGAVVALATGAIGFADIPVVWHIVWDATFTFVGLIIISLLLDEAGGRRLFPLVVILGAAISALFANDGAALLLTPIVMAILLRLEFSHGATLAFVIATGFVADSTSLPLVISNLVNIVSANYWGITFDRYAAVMVPVDLAALAATLLVLWLYYGREIAVGYPVTDLEPPSSAIRDHAVFRAASPLLGVLLVAYFALAPLGIPVSAVTGAAALMLLVVAGRWYPGGGNAVVSVRRVLKNAPWQIVVFSLGMYLVVYGLRNAGLTAYLAQGLDWLGGHGPWAAAIGTGFGAAILSSVMNNMPSVLIGSLAIEQAHGLSPAIHELMVYANVIGCDLGPKFTPIGSLATLLWLHVLAQKGQTISWGQYMKVGLIITPPVLLIVLAALTLWLPTVGTP
jgi:arsenical pump membrane protein